MSANSPFNLPLQCSSLTKTAALDQYSTSQFGMSGIGLITPETQTKDNNTSSSNFPNDNHQIANAKLLLPKGNSRQVPCNRICIYNPHMKTHYSSSSGSPALSGTNIDYEGSVLNALPKKIAKKVNAQMQSSLSLDNSLSQVLDAYEHDHQKMLQEKIRLKGAKSTPIKVCQIHNAPESTPEELKCKNIYNTPEIDQDKKITEFSIETEKTNSPSEFDVLYTKKNELFSTFHEKYELSPETLNKFYEVATLETQFLKTIKKKAKAVTKAKMKIKDLYKPINNTQAEEVPDIMKTASCGSCEIIMKKLLKIVKDFNIKEEYSKNNSSFMNSENLLNNIVNYMKSMQADLKTQKDEYIKKHSQLHHKYQKYSTKKAELQDTMNKFEQEKAEFEKRQKEWFEYEKYKMAELKESEEKLKEDWEKLKVLEEDAKIMNTMEVTKKAKPMPKSASKATKKYRQISAISIGQYMGVQNQNLTSGSQTTRRNVGMRKSLNEVSTARNQDGTSRMQGFR